MGPKGPKDVVKNNLFSPCQGYLKKEPAKLSVLLVAEVSRTNPYNHTGLKQINIFLRTAVFSYIIINRKFGAKEIDSLSILLTL